MKKIYYFVLIMFLIGGTIISCERAQEIVPEEQSAIRSRSGDINDEMSDLVDRSFTFDIEGNGGSGFAVDIINRIKGQEHTVTVTQGMCPYRYKLYVPRNISDNDYDVEIIATKSCIRYILGFRDRSGMHCHADTYHYSLFLTDDHSSTPLTAVFDRDYPRTDPLPVGGDGDSRPEQIYPQVTDVGIDMQRSSGVFAITANCSRLDNLQSSTSISDGYTRINNVLCLGGLELTIFNTSYYAGQLFFSVKGQTQRVLIGAKAWAIVSYSLNDGYGFFSVKIQ